MTGLHRNLFAWTGWLFTVGGTVFGLAVSGAYAWIGALCAVAGLLALTALAYQRHQELTLAEARHVADRNRLEGDLRTARERTDVAERRLHAIPADLLAHLEAAVEAHSFVELARLLAQHANFVERMKNLAGVLAKPMRAKTFVKRAGSLYVVAGLDQSAFAHLEDADPFILEFKDASGLVTASAQLQVHQKEPTKEILWFLVASHLADEMDHVDALADIQDFPAKGYSVRPDCDLNQYTNLDLAEAGILIQRLADEIARSRG